MTPKLCNDGMIINNALPEQWDISTCTIFQMHVLSMFWTSMKKKCK